MESRKKFRPEITDKYIRSKFAKVKLDKKKPDSRDGSLVNLIEAPKINSHQHYVPTIKDKTREQRSYVTVKKEVQLRPEQVLKIERENVLKKLKFGFRSHRGAEIWKKSTETDDSSRTLDVDDDTFLKTIQEKKKNYGKEFLQTFRHRVDQINTGSKKRKRSPEVAQRIPKLDIKPGATEIVL